MPCETMQQGADLFPERARFYDEQGKSMKGHQGKSMKGHQGKSTKDHQGKSMGPIPPDSMKGQDSTNEGKGKGRGKARSGKGAYCGYQRASQEGSGGRGIRAIICDKLLFLVLTIAPSQLQGRTYPSGRSGRRTSRRSRSRSG